MKKELKKNRSKKNVLEKTKKTTLLRFYVNEGSQCQCSFNGCVSQCHYCET